MNLFKKALVTGMMGLGICAVSAPDAEAGSFYFGIGNGYYGGYGGYGGGYGWGHPGGRVWHDTGHYDYYPGTFQRHYDHYHYIPGHYHYHDTGHWDHYGGWGGHHHHHGHW